MQEYIGIIILLAVALAMGAVMLVLNWFLGPKKRPTPVKDEPYECGVAPFELPAGRSSVKFFVGAILFVVFDIELLFLYLWAVKLRDLGWLGLIEVFIFLGILVLGFIYAWRKGVLEWK